MCPLFELWETPETTTTIPNDTSINSILERYNRLLCELESKPGQYLLNSEMTENYMEYNDQYQHINSMLLELKSVYHYDKNGNTSGN